MLSFTQFESFLEVISRKEVLQIRLQFISHILNAHNSNDLTLFSALQIMLITDQWAWLVHVLAANRKAVRRF